MKAEKDIIKCKRKIDEDLSYKSKHYKDILNSNTINITLSNISDIN